MHKQYFLCQIFELVLRSRMDPHDNSSHINNEDRNPSYDPSQLHTGTKPKDRREGKLIFLYSVNIRIKIMEAYGF